jgi:osmoprotectant transport system ATP-binding protein
MPASVELREVCVDVRADAGAQRILDHVSLSIAAGEAVTFIGRSGAGKTTALRLINGLVTPSRGEVRVDDVPLASSDLIALRRRTGYIIQGSGLFPHRTVYDNVATVPRLLGWNEEKIRAAADELLKMLGLPGFQNRMPRSLSGGEQQRVGIARAIIAEPSILLCDEPFGALDPIVRRELQDVFRATRSRGDATIIFVTHDLAEAVRVAERVVVFDHGTIADDVPAHAIASSSSPAAQALVEAAKW